MKGPAKNPCGSCPYRKDVPSGVWAAEEYEKLPPFDKPTGEQPMSVFLCHQQDGRLCAGWVGCHDMDESFGLRIALATGQLSLEEVEEIHDYETEVPLFASGAEAAEHGMRDLANPDPRAQRTVNHLLKKIPVLEEGR